jgi:hypothetical protein
LQRESRIFVFRDADQQGLSLSPLRCSGSRGCSLLAQHLL